MRPHEIEKLKDSFEFAFRERRRKSNEHAFICRNARLKGKELEKSDPAAWAASWHTLGKAARKEGKYLAMLVENGIKPKFDEETGRHTYEKCAPVPGCYSAYKDYFEEFEK